METVLCSHILTAAKECTDSSRMTCNEVAKWIVKIFLKMTVPKFEEPSSATRPDSGATEPASNLTNATINPTSGIQLATVPTPPAVFSLLPTPPVVPSLPMRRLSMTRCCQFSWYGFILACISRCY